MNRIRKLLSDMRLGLRAKRVERRLHSQQVIDLTGDFEQLHERLERLEEEVAELRADSRRIAELRVLVEDSLLRD